MSGDDLVDTGADGAPWWLAVALVLLLAGAALVVVRARRTA